MALKITTDPHARQTPRTYPKLMVSENGRIVLMTAERQGTVIGAIEGSDLTGASTKPGYYSDDWAMSCFTDFEGTITVSND